MFAAWGGIVAKGGAQVNAVAAAAAALAGFTGNSQDYSQQAGNEAVIPDFANNRVLVEQGVYRVEGSFSFLSGAFNANFLLCPAKNGVAQTDLAAEMSALNIAATRISCEFSGILKVLASDCSQQPYVGPAAPGNVPASPQPTQQPPVAVLTVLAQATAGGPQNLTFTSGQFNVYKIV